MTLKEKIESQGARADKQRSDNPDHYRGFDWCALAPEEEAVFAIDPLRFPRMVVAWEAYQVFMDIVGCDAFDYDEAVVAAERARRKDIIERGIDDLGFRLFAMEYAGLTMREAAAWYAKHDFWQVRRGLVRYSDETK
jgi:hypothetical protein